MARKRINWRMLLRLIGGLLFIEALFMLIPMIVGIIYGENDWRVFAFSAGITAICGFVMWNSNPSNPQMGKREGFLLTALVWVAFSIFGMLPHMFSTSHISLSDSFFESMSAFTTTGATSVDPEVDSHAIIMWQAIMQWVGGMGIILFTLAVIPALNNAGGMQMFNAEVTGVTHDKLRPRISQTALTLWGLYTALTFILVALLWLGPMNLFDSICHAFGTVSTGGFSSTGGLEGFGSDYILVVIGIFMFLGGTNFALIYKAVTGHWRVVKSNSVLKAYICSIGIFTVFFALASILISPDITFRNIFLLPLFQVISCISSTGFLAPELSIWEPGILAIVIIMMFSGACAGSTSGGAKIDRILFMNKFVKNELRRALSPNAVLPVKINHTVANPDLVKKTIAFLCMFVMVIVAGATILSFMGLPILDSFFSTLACICNTGFSATIDASLSELPSAAKWVLSAVMLTGRLEIYTILVLLTPAFWK